MKKIALLLTIAPAMALAQPSNTNTDKAKIAAVKAQRVSSELKYLQKMVDNLPTFPDYNTSASFNCDGDSDIWRGGIQDSMPGDEKRIKYRVLKNGNVEYSLRGNYVTVFKMKLENNRWVVDDISIKDRGKHSHKQVLKECPTTYYQ